MKWKRNDNIMALNGKKWQQNGNEMEINCKLKVIGMVME